MLHNTATGLPPGFSAGLHPGDWRLHRVMTASGPGDFTPYRADPTPEEKIGPHRSLGEWLGGYVGWPFTEQADIEAGG
jgi:hypothetical protein